MSNSKKTIKNIYLTILKVKNNTKYNYNQIKYYQYYNRYWLIKSTIDKALDQKSGAKVWAKSLILESWYKKINSKIILYSIW